MLLCFAILCLPAFAFVPRATLQVEKANQRVASFALGLHRGPAAAKPFIAAGIPRCLYTSRTEYEHDMAGRTTRVIQITEGRPATAGSRAVSYQYWASDRISETTLPSSRRVVECIDARLRVSWASATKTLNDCTGNAAVSASEAYLSAAEYAAHGVPLRWQLGNGCGSAPDDQLCLEWSYGASTNNGNIAASRQWERKTAVGFPNLQASYGYNGRNRLTHENKQAY